MARTRWSPRRKPNVAQIAATLNELRSRIETGQMVDQVLSYARGHGGSQFRQARLGDQVKTNPLPIALVAAGLGWLMVGQPPAPEARAHSPSIVPDNSIGPGGGSRSTSGSTT